MVRLAYFTLQPPDVRVRSPVYAANGIEYLRLKRPRLADISPLKGFVGTQQVRRHRTYIDNAAYGDVMERSMGGGGGAVNNMGTSAMGACGGGARTLSIRQHICAISGYGWQPSPAGPWSAHGYVTGRWERVSSMGTQLWTVERMDTSTGRPLRSIDIVSGHDTHVEELLEPARRLPVGGNSMLISLNLLFHSLRARHVPPGQPGAAGASFSDAGTLLSQLEDWCHEPQTPLVTRTCEARRLLHATWGAAQRAVREALDGVEAGAAQLPEEVRRAVSSRDAARAEHTCGMEALLHTEERQWAAVVAQISGWRTVLTAAGGQPTQGEDDHSGVVAHGRAAALTARANDAVAAYRAWEQRSARAAHLAEESDRRVAALRTQLQELFDSSSGAPTYTVEAGSAELDAATWHAQTALEAEQHFREAAGAADPAPVEGLVAAGWAVLAELQEGEEAMQGGLVTVRAEIQELRRAQEDATAGCVAAAGVELRAANRMLRRQRLHLGELKQVLARCQMDLEEQAEEMPGEEVDRGEVDEAAARVATKKAEVEVAQRRLRAATCALVALGPQFPEVVYFLEHGVPPELLSLWRADCFLEDFAACSLSARQGSRHEVWQVRDSRGHEFAVKVYPITQGNPGALRALWREAALLHRMRHPGIVPILAIFLSHQAGSTNFYGLQMPWYEHGQLDEWKAAQQPDEGAVRRGMLRVLEAVAHLHGNKVLHCDIKPANILVDASGRPHLLDFDISVDTATRTSVTYLQETTLRGVRGTDGYMAPELASTGPTTATDMYAYGMTFAAVAPADGQRGAELQELLRGLTAEDPGMRPSAAEACRHPYFAGVWEWQRTQMRVCCVQVELSTCGGAQHSLSDGVECSNRGGPAHFVCGRCLAAHAQRESEGRDGRVRCPCAQGASMPTSEQDPAVAERNRQRCSGKSWSSCGNRYSSLLVGNQHLPRAMSTATTPRKCKWADRGGTQKPSLVLTPHKEAHGSFTIMHCTVSSIQGV
ncbi:hypothetical protein CYMTET_23812 [Cymbomonas tetramitiformis]|uniref:Protein kinase domain-containing protein n=1 Tax=Cymbomonas tetramitiformis TaxID=36881 RepID=A0AAE0L0J3_9CHLO|nr:hypothetical protein CYMTET_23812 [Cymbomonas tetramitiformis]